MAFNAGKHLKCIHVKLTEAVSLVVTKIILTFCFFCFLIALLKKIVNKPRLEIVQKPRVVILEKRANGLGFSIVGGRDSAHGDLPIYVKTVFEKNGAAEKADLKPGDRILAVDGVSLEGLTHEEAVAILKNSQGFVRFTVA